MNKNNNKSIILTLISALILGLFLINGCKTVITNNPDGTSVTNKVVDVKTVTNSINFVVPLAVQVAVGADTNSVPYFNAAIVTIQVLARQGEYDPQYLEDSLKASSGLQTPEAKLAIQAGLGLYKAYIADSINLNSKKLDYGVVLVAFSEALKTGLAREPIVLKSK